MKKYLGIFVLAIFLFATTLGTFASAPAGEDMSKVYGYLKQELKIDDPAKEFVKVKTTIDNLGYQHVKVQQTVSGIPVFGGDFIVHIDKNGKAYATSGNYNAKAKTAKISKNFIAKEEAIKIAKTAVNYNPNNENAANDTFSAQLYLYNVNGEFTPVYMTNVKFTAPEPGNWLVFVNAENGTVVDKLNNIRTSNVVGTGIGTIGDTKSINLDYTGGVYYLKDTTKPMTGTIYTNTASYRNSVKGTLMSDTDAIWNSADQAAGVDANYYLGITYDYYKLRFNRNSLDNNGISIKAVVHYGKNYANAFWDGSEIAIGDGDGTSWGCFASDVDIVAHELTHGVGAYEANLTYSNQSGAWDECIADIMSVYTKDYYFRTVKGTTCDEWLLCEEAYTPGIIGDTYYSYPDPAAYNYPDHMSKYVNTTSDNGGVHRNCTIPGHAIYMFDQQMGHAKSEQIVYRAYCNYFTSSTTFSQGRAAMLQAAADLYGQGGVEYNAVAAGFDHVGVY